MNTEQTLAWSQFIKDNIDESIDWTRMSNQTWQNIKCYAIKSGRNALLDVARKMYKEITDDIFDYILALSKSTGLNLKQIYNQQRGFLIKMIGYQDQSSLPQAFAIVSRLKNGYILQTMDLMKYNERLKESMSEIFAISEQ